MQSLSGCDEQEWHESLLVHVHFFSFWSGATLSSVE